MFKTDIVLDLIAKTLGMEESSKELHVLLELYALAYVEDLEATEDLSAARAAYGAELVGSEELEQGELWQAPEEVDADLLAPATVEEGACTAQPCAEAASHDWNEEPKSYRGFLSLRCAHCNTEVSYSSKYPLTHHKCKACGEKTALADMTVAYINCECGQRSRYTTNQTQWGFDIPCIACGNLVPVEYIAAKHIYATVGTHRKKGRKT